MSNPEAELKHSLILQRVLNWAQRCGVSSDHIVKSLVQDFAAEENLAIWATMDPFEYLPQSDPTSGRKYIGWAKNAATFRNLLVFLPVALTWEAVSKATEAFGKFIENNTATTANFLEFWQNGYDVLPKFWTISKIATLDFAIILVIIGLSLASTVLSSRASSLNKWEMRVKGEERLEMALALKLYLYSMREIDKSNVNEGVAASVSALLGATSSLSKSAKQLTAVIDGLYLGVPAINEFGAHLGSVSGKLVREVEGLTNALSVINGSIINELHDAVNSATIGLELANEELSQSTKSIHTNSLAARDEIKSLQSMIKKLSRSR